MLKKIIAGLLICTMAGSLMAGCGNDGGDGGNDGGSGKVSMAIWHGGAEDTDETSNHQRYLKMANGFMEANPDYEVKVVGSVTAEKLMTAMSSGTGPDIGQPNWVHCGQWGEEGIIADLQSSTKTILSPQLGTDVPIKARFTVFLLLSTLPNCITTKISWMKQA